MRECGRAGAPAADKHCSRSTRWKRSTVRAAGSGLDDEAGRSDAARAGPTCSRGLTGRTSRRGSSRDRSPPDVGSIAPLCLRSAPDRSHRSARHARSGPVRCAAPGGGAARRPGASRRSALGSGSRSGRRRPASPGRSSARAGQALAREQRGGPSNHPGSYAADIAPSTDALLTAASGPRVRWRLAHGWRGLPTPRVIRHRCHAGRAGHPTDGRQTPRR